MALPTFGTQSNATYLRVGVGEDDKKRKRAVLGRRVKEGTPGAAQVFKANGEPALAGDGSTVWRTEHPYIEGRIIKIERRQPEYNGKAVDELNISVVDKDGELLVLQLTKGDEYWGDFAQRVPKLDFGKPVKIAPYMIPKEDQHGNTIEGKYNRMLVLYQDGVKLDRAYKKDDPDGPPPVTYDADEKKWMWGKRNNWLDKGPIEEAIKLASFHNSAEPTPEERVIPGEGMSFDDDIL